MDDAELFDRQYASLREFCRMLGQASPGARVVEVEDVIAAVVPAAPERAVPNSVAYGSAAGLGRALPEIAAAYEDAAVRAWTVWVPHFDAESEVTLERAGHFLDADPAAMAMELESFEAPHPDWSERRRREAQDFRWGEAPDMHLGLDLDPEPTLGTVARLNDLSYTFGSDDFERSLQHAPALHLHVARVDGRPVACTTGHDHDGDFSVTFTATVPEARGRGLAARLLTHALHEAHERGCTTTSLQATKMGRPVYERLGYRNLGPLHMWERRTT